MGGSRGFCVQCGHELTSDSRFCTACGCAVTATGHSNPAFTEDRKIRAREHEITMMTLLRTDDMVRQESSAEEQRWPAQATNPVLVPAFESETNDNPVKVRHVRRTHRWWLLAFPVAAILAASATALIFVLRTSHAGQPNAGRHANASIPVSTSTTPVSASPSPTFSPSPTQQEAANSLAELLAQSNSARSSANSAVMDIDSCGPSLSQDQKILEDSAASRQQLLSKLDSFPGHSTLPAPMLQDLANAWEESVTADQEFARWAQDESSQGCIQNDHANPNYKAAGDPDDRAKADKIAFTKEWNKIATRYGVTTYKWDQL